MTLRKKVISMSGFWMEMHCHSATGSGCAKVYPTETPKLYVNAGYNGLVATDHFCLKMQHPGSYEEYKVKVERAILGYHVMKIAAPEDFTVLLGAEMSLSTQSGCNHFLVYGLDEQFLYDSFCMTEMTLEELYNYLHENGKMIFQAHPYREGCSRNDPRFLDGIEAFNNPRAKLPDNLQAEKWGIEHNMPMISGSDFHTVDATASGGVCFPREIRTNDDLLAALKEGNYKIKRNSDY